MTPEERTALASFASEMSTAFAKLAHTLSGGEPTALTPTSPAYGPASMQMSWNERVLRQSLILHEIQQRGGNVPQTSWYDIALRYGYSGRGLAGFFRRDGRGLLELRENGKVYITKRGKERLRQNQERVAQKLAETAAAG